MNEKPPARFENTVFIPVTSKSATRVYTGKISTIGKEFRAAQFEVVNIRETREERPHKNGHNVQVQNAETPERMWVHFADKPGYRMGFGVTHRHWWNLLSKPPFQTTGSATPAKVTAVDADNDEVAVQTREDPFRRRRIYLMHKAVFEKLYAEPTAPAPPGGPQPKGEPSP
ncbi:MAG: hypothetical protein M3N08_03710 [Pseudomonadota bacterium]|nr:hypothetical protein [Pseudomonadota bacterium]